MKKKFRSVLAEKCKDFGLTDKALDDLAELGSKDLTEESTDEDIAAKADLLVPFAKAMQGEITRKTQGKPSAKQSTGGNPNEDDDQTGEGKGEGEKKPNWVTEIKTRLEALENENKALKEEKETAARKATIAEKAKKLGIPEFLMQGREFDKDTDIDKALADFKQQLVNHNLMSKGQGYESATSKDKMASEEDAWAKGLPNKN